jgi:hypothetical protein
VGNSSRVRTGTTRREKPVTVPEESRRKTDTTDEVIREAAPGADDERAGGEGSTIREALQDAGVRPEDYEERDREGS